jgi:hypothetical protein
MSLPTTLVQDCSAKRCNADLLKVLIRQVAQYSEIDVVLGKALGVLGHAELFEPGRRSHLLERGFRIKGPAAQLRPHPLAADSRAAATLLTRDEASHLQCICKVGHSP